MPEHVLNPTSGLVAPEPELDPQVHREPYNDVHHNLRTTQKSERALNPIPSLVSKTGPVLETRIHWESPKPPDLQFHTSELDKQEASPW